MWYPPICPGDKTSCVRVCLVVPWKAALGLEQHGKPFLICWTTGCCWPVGVVNLGSVLASTKIYYLVARLCWVCAPWEWSQLSELAWASTFCVSGLILRRFLVNWMRCSQPETREKLWGNNNSNNYHRRGLSYILSHLIHSYYQPHLILKRF